MISREAEFNHVTDATFHTSNSEKPATTPHMLNKAITYVVWNVAFFSCGMEKYTVLRLILLMHLDN